MFVMALLKEKIMILLSNIGLLRYHIKQHETTVNLKSHYEDPAHVIRRST